MEMCSLTGTHLGKKNISGSGHDNQRKKEPGGGTDGVASVVSVVSSACGDLSQPGVAHQCGSVLHSSSVPSYSFQFTAGLWGRGGGQGGKTVK